MFRWINARVILILGFSSVACLLCTFFYLFREPFSSSFSTIIVGLIGFITGLYIGYKQIVDSGEPNRSLAYIAGGLLAIVLGALFSIISYLIILFLEAFFYTYGS